MFVTRASRHDLADIEDLMNAESWDVPEDMKVGKFFIARDGKVAGCLRMVEVAPRATIVEDVLVRSDKRKQGIGTQLMQAAMNNHGGSLYLCSHEETLEYYERFGFTRVAPEALPEPVSNYFDSCGDLTPPEGHVHYFMTAR